MPQYSQKRARSNLPKWPGTQWDKIGPCHKFLFLPYPDCNRVTFKHINEFCHVLYLCMPSWSPVKALSHGSSPSLMAMQHAWLDLLPWNFFQGAPCTGCHGPTSRTYKHNKSFNFIYLFPSIIPGTMLEWSLKTHKDGLFSSIYSTQAFLGFSYHVPQNSSSFYPFNSVQFSLSVVSNSLQPHESQNARPPCPSQTPGVYSNSCPLSQWCHPAISSSVVPFFSCPQSLPASGSFPMSQLFTWGGQSIGVSASTSVLLMNTQDWSPLGWTGWISLQFKDSQESSPTP